MLGKFSEGKSQVTLNLIASESHEALPRIDGMQDSWLKFNNVFTDSLANKEKLVCQPCLLDMEWFSFRT